MNPPDPALIDQLVLANRILYDQGVVDGLGHVNVSLGRALAKTLGPVDPDEA